MELNHEIDVRPLTPTIGAECYGIDLKNLNQSEFRSIQQLWLDYKVLFFRDQKFDLESLCQFSERFGGLMRLPYIKPVDQYPNVICVRKEANEINMGVFGGDWHSDFSFLPAPPKASILYSEVLPPIGGDTLWINMAMAWNTLPEATRNILRGRSAIHIGAPYGVKHAPDESIQFKGSIEIERNNPEADNEILHPAVCKHPDTGEEMLFVSPTYTVGLDGLSKEESQNILNQVYLHSQRPEFSCRFRWHQGTVAMWDNRNTMHYAVNDYDGYQRVLYRTTIEGHPPIAA